MKAILKNNKIEISFQYDPNLVEKMHKLGGNQWSKITKKWYCLPLKDNVIKLNRWNFACSEEVQNLTLPKKREEIIPLEVSGMKKELFHFQKQGVAFIESKKGRALIADEMGCISGDSEIELYKYSFSKGYKFKEKIKIKDLYSQPLKNLYALSMLMTIGTYQTPFLGGVLVYNKIERIIYKGKKQVFHLTSKNHQIKATDDHIFFTEDGEKELKYLIPNKDKVYVRNESFASLETIISKEPCGKEDVYDIAMKSPNHNFVANGIIVHNCGKTIQSLAWLQYHPEIRPAIIISPASIKLNWRNEINSLLTSNKKTYIINGKTQYELPIADIYICNYDILSSHLDNLKKVNPQAIIADEFHYCQDSKTQRTKAAQELCKGIKHIIGLTGTPIVNRPKEMFIPISIINPNLFPKFFQYGIRYCNGKQNKWGWDFNGSSNKEELNEILSSNIMIRRTKKEVLPELPEKIRSIIPIEINNRKEYTKAENDFKEWLQKEKGKINTSAEALTQIEYLKQISAKGKLDTIYDWIEDFLSQENKLVIMANHTFIIEELENYFKEKETKYVKLVGGMTPEEKEKSVSEFQNNSSVKVFIGNIKAAGVGITLTAANTMACIELGWNPGTHDQMEDRIHRIGTKECCNIYYFIGENTIEEKIIALIDAKRAIINAIIDGKETENTNMLSELLNEYYEKRDET